MVSRNVSLCNLLLQSAINKQKVSITSILLDSSSVNHSRGQTKVFERKKEKEKKKTKVFECSVQSSTTSKDTRIYYLPTNFAINHPDTACVLPSPRS